MADPIPVRGEIVASDYDLELGAELVRRMFLAGYKGRTLEAYTTDLAMWFAFCALNGQPVLSAHRAHIELFIRHEENRGLQNSTIARRVGTICTFYRYCSDEDYIRKNPGAHVRRPKVPQESTTQGLDRAELSRFLVTAAGMGVKEHALACVLALNGLRVSEACQLNIEDIATDRGHTVISFIGKGEKPAVQPIAPATKRAMFALIGERTQGPLFLRRDGQRMDRHTARRIVRRITRKAEINKRISPHSLRHTFVTVALDSGVELRDVQNSARHADPRTTSRYDRARQNLDRHCTYIVAGSVATG